MKIDVSSSCQECQKHRAECVFYSSEKYCERCIRFGSICCMNSVPSPKRSSRCQRACQECQRTHTRCIKLPGSNICEKCIRTGHPCRSGHQRKRGRKRKSAEEDSDDPEYNPASKRPHYNEDADPDPAPLSPLPPSVGVFSDADFPFEFDQPLYSITIEETVTYRIYQ